MKFIIDENLPQRFSLWLNYDCQYVTENNFLRTDSQIWDFAKENEFIIVTKDADFFERMLLNEPPPKVIHLKMGNMKISDLYIYLTNIWEKVVKLIETHKLVIVYQDRIETLG